jgi:hypothetical protein
MVMQRTSGTGEGGENMEQKKLSDRYAEFMGSWMAGTVIGHFLGKLVVAVFVIWMLGKILCQG